ncbi:MULTISPECIES: metallophosphoesterase [unclassified Corallococcus]|uniref:metallophosphoesterase n=1 Tax=unclassified Corallococcus TaxID=2685029 RepID=UPI001A8F1B5B|nr:MULTISPECIES: metallophosphoesterase [unclassified Corallococcus]MBN9683953.1 metallophosphoesterase [Corallococcus sp. NCSPR001]WAS84546.1 metallophosphoesterase [Corallococcus sp. NCRR]
MPQDSLLVAALGDIHGRFHRVEAWLDALEQARGRKVDLVLAVGDVEAFRHADDHRRKAAKRSMPAEFAGYADGIRRMKRPLYFIGGNNEDFEALHDLPEGGELAPDVHYLGRAGLRTLGPLRVAYLSGIHAPRFIDQPLKRPTSLDTAKQAGYFRTPEVEQVAALRDVDLLLVHEWPRGIVQKARDERLAPARPLPSPWIGNPVTRKLVDTVHPRWVLCGHSHKPFAVTLDSHGRALSRVACLDQAARPDTAVFWLEFEGREAQRAGWGVSGVAAWQAGQRWGLHTLPPLDASDGPGSVPADNGATA